MQTTIKPSDMQLAEQKRAVWQAFAPPECCPEDLLRPESWAHVARKVEPFSRIEVLAEDGTWWAEYMILLVGPNWVKVALMRQHDFRAVAVQASDPETLEVNYIPARKWRVLRKSDGAVLREGLATKEEANAWKQEHLKTMAA
jgi:hypothetical protein